MLVAQNAAAAPASPHISHSICANRRSSRLASDPPLFPNCFKVGDSPPPACEALAGADIFNHGHLPIAAAYCRRLGLVELVDQDVELLLGESVPAHAFNDTNLARSLDAMFAAGTSKIVTELGIRATPVFRLDTTVASYDTTSTSVGATIALASWNSPPGGLGSLMGTARTTSRNSNSS